MKRLVTLTAVLGLTGLTACANMTPSEQRALSGTAIGAGAGAAIGAIAGAPGTGAAIGAGAGLLGGVIADQAARGRERQYAYEYRDGYYYYDHGYYDDRGVWHYYEDERRYR